ncbi:hypothetical protein EVAR_74362_1 [Eumeta japonica]|uniref:Uncharacterized protein n=1 Tax=Eumeta variegata TaxID=151549 RepID=A0A4C1SD80_EUMVA|nr:hypothetical protein EVAR_74362_1 [Eumeta japonica]
MLVRSSTVTSVQVVSPLRSVAFGSVPWTTRLVCVTAWQYSFEPRSVVSGSACVRVCGVPRSVNRAAAVKPRASVPVISSGYPAVCTPSPHTVSAPRVCSSSFTLRCRSLF